MQRIRAARGSSQQDGELRFSSGTRTLLVVDDEPEALEMLAAVFGLEGYRVLRASEGAKALSIIGSERPDLMIVDYMMPGMSGIELSERLRADEATSDIPIILYTAYSIPELKAKKGLFDRTFAKPADVDELLGAVRTLLTMH